MSLIDAEVMTLASAHSNYVRRDVLRRHGVSARVERRLVRDGVLRPLVGQLLVVGEPPTERLRRLEGALLQAGPNAVVSHLAAAESWRFPAIGHGRLDVVVPRDAGRTKAGLGRIHTSRDLGPPDVVELHGLPHTNPARTLLDIAVQLSRTHLDRCLQHACQQGLTTPAEVHELIQLVRRRGRPGIHRLLPLVEVAIDLPALESWLEGHLHALIERSSLPQPEWQAPVTVDGLTYRPDATWRAEALIVEADGYATHSTRADNQRDAERRNRLELAGYRVMVFTYDDIVGRPTYVLAMIGRHLALHRAD